ncbi:hypothetical protein ACFSYE_12315 [Roseibacillus ishigakijimensis]
MRKNFESWGIEHPDWMSFYIREAWEHSQSGEEFDELSFLMRVSEIRRDAKNSRKIDAEEWALEHFEGTVGGSLSGDPFAEAIESEEEADREKIPLSVEVRVRGIGWEEGEKQYLEPVEAILKKWNVGTISSSGGSGDGEIAENYFRIDFSDSEKGLPLLRKSIGDLAFPAGTMMRYTQDGYSHQEYFKWHHRRVRVD